jgi:FkbM family methyltransferase
MNIGNLEMQKSKEKAARTPVEPTVGDSFKLRTQLFLRRLGIYHRLRCSYLYDLYWGFADRKLVENRRKEVEFYRRTLTEFKKGDLIFDIGANVGQKTDIFLRLGAKVVAVEPDASNQEVLRQSFLRLLKKPVVVVGKAVSDESGSQIMWINEPGSAMNTLSTKWVESLRTDASRFGKRLDFEQAIEVATTTLEELIKSYGLPFYVKIDVEGCEESVLSGLQTAVRFVSFEVNLPQFKPEALKCINHLERIAGGGCFNYASDCLRGLAFESWMSKEIFVDVLNSCQESSVEVFWRAPAAQN